MSASRRRRGLASRATGRLAFGLLLGELVGGTIGLFVGTRRHPEANAGSAALHPDHAASEPRLSRVDQANGSDDDTADPLVTWPLVGLAAGAIIGVAAAAGTTRHSEVTGR